MTVHSSRQESRFVHTKRSPVASPEVEGTLSLSLSLRDEACDSLVV